jgi:hypothetical protein
MREARDLGRVVINSRWAPPLFFAFAAVALLWPALLGSHTLLPSSLLYFIPPWTPQHPADVSSYFNPVLSDIPTAYYPWWQHAREALRSGSVPQWNPYALAGTPFYANAQSALFSPFNVPMWVLPFKYAFGVAAAMRLWVGSFGAYLLCRELGVGRGPALLGGLAFGFSSFSVLWLSFPVLSVLALLPWAVWLTERVLSRGRSVDGLFLALVLAVALLGGHPGSEVHLYLAVVAYAGLRVVLVDSAAGARLRRLGVIAAALGLGLLLAALVLVPVAFAIPGTVGVDVRTGSALNVPWAAARTFFFPDWWGRPSGAYYSGPFNYNERTVYAGAVAFVLALLGLMSLRTWRRTVPFAVLIVVGFQSAFGLQPTEWVLNRAPLLEHDRNARLSVLIQLGTSVLAAFGLDAVARGRVGVRRLAIAAVVVAAVAITGLLGTHATLNQLRTAVHHFRTGENFGVPNVIAAVSVGWWILLAGALVLLLFLRNRLGPLTVTIAVLLLAAVDYGHFARRYNPMPPASVAFPRPPESVRFLQEHVGHARIAGLGVTLPPDTSTIYRLPDIRGNDPPGPDKEFMRVFRLINPQQSASDWLAIPVITSKGRSLLNLFDVRYLVTPPNTAPDQPGFSAVYRGADADVYRNDRAATRTFVPGRVVTRKTEAGVFSVLSAAGFDPANKAVVETSSRIAAAAGKAVIVRDDPERVEVMARLSRGGLVALADAFDDGWRVQVDGKTAEQLRVDGVLRGVVVPAGSHRVSWRYRTPGLARGVALSGIGVGALLAWALVAVVAGRRRRTGSAGDEQQAPADQDDAKAASEGKSLVQHDPSSNDDGDVTTADEDRINQRELKAPDR